MNDNQCIYFHIDTGTSADQIFILLESVQRFNENEIQEKMNDSDT